MRTDQVEVELALALANRSPVLALEMDEGEHLFYDTRNQYGCVAYVAALSDNETRESNTW